ncbi:hypothetical protein CO653_30290 [Rhizobium anhuiense]|uniref:DUF3307 domain-containing protein n=1 Tax=Rhizobium anhuiense TaxID=1184720 RepID=UPI000BE98D9C|nr:DUF3307 domain-containing protein [Rhizobium anhuiense]PDS61973.1 hypothetical protein CO653_30290 [Rhizobium anhuiense]
MNMATIFVSVLVWLQFKHFVADYLLQPAWILEGKGDFRKSGGYAHAGLHACGSFPAFYLIGIDGTRLVVFAAFEFVVHYLIDHVKAVYSHNHPYAPRTFAFWALHGADQMLHHLTYSGLLLMIMVDASTLVAIPDPL